MTNVAELVAEPGTERTRLPLLLKDLAVETFEVPSEVHMDGDTLFSDNDPTCIQCLDFDVGSWVTNCQWNDPSEVCW
jgi:hypothetical protein